MDNNEAKKLQDAELKMVNGGAARPISSRTIEKGIIAIISKKFNVPASTINMNTTWDDLSADSLDVVDVVSSIEEEFEYKKPTNPIKTVGDLLP